jgi:hypothetical protein
MPKTTRSNQYAAQLNAGNLGGQRIDDGRQLSAQPQYTFCVVDFDGSNVAADVVTLVKLPPGAIVLPSLSKIIVSTALTTGVCTMDVGDVTNRTRYCAGANCAALGSVDFLSAVATAGFPAGFLTRQRVVEDPSPLLDTTLVTVRIATLTLPTAGRFVVMVAYATI